MATAAAMDIPMPRPSMITTEFLIAGSKYKLVIPNTANPNAKMTDSGKFCIAFRSPSQNRSWKLSLIVSSIIRVVFS
jgi:hypothetical protein